MLKQFRTRLGLTLAEAAEKIDVHFQTVLRWEQGVTSPTLEQVPSIRKAYNLTDAEVLALFEREAS